MEKRYLKNTTIYHPVYGNGVILSVFDMEDAYSVMVDFESVGIKTLLSLVNPLDEPERFGYKM